MTVCQSTAFLAVIDLLKTSNIIITRSKSFPSRHSLEKPFILDPILNETITSQFLQLRSPTLIHITTLLNLNLIKNQDHVRFSSARSRRTRQPYAHPNTPGERRPQIPSAGTGGSLRGPPAPRASSHRDQPFTSFLEPGFGFRLARLTRGRARSRSRALAPPPRTGAAMTDPAKPLPGALGRQEAHVVPGAALRPALRPWTRPCRAAAPAAPSARRAWSPAAVLERVCVCVALPHFFFFFFSSLDM